MDLCKLSTRPQCHIISYDYTRFHPSLANIGWRVWHRNVAYRQIWQGLFLPGSFKSILENLQRRLIQQGLKITHFTCRVSALLRKRSQKYCKDRNHDKCVFALDQENHYSSQKDAVKNLLSKSVVTSRAISVIARARLMVGPVPCVHFTTPIKKTSE